MTLFTMSDTEIPFNEIDRAMQTLPKAMISNVLAAGLAGAARAVVRQARKTAPRRTGLYRRSIRVRRKKVRFRDRSTGKRYPVPLAFAVAGAWNEEARFKDAFYAYFLEFGTGAGYGGTGTHSLGAAYGQGIAQMRIMERAVQATRRQQLSAFRAAATKQFRKLRAAQLKRGIAPPLPVSAFPDVRDVG